MSKDKYTDLRLETLYQIWDDKSGDHIDIGPDRDGLDLIEIRSYSSRSHNHEADQRITMTRDQLEKLQTAIDLTLNPVHGQ